MRCKNETSSTPAGPGGAGARAIAALLPQRTHDLARLGLLGVANRPPVVTVIGKYNHGKSRLLNALVGREILSVADRRETVALSEHLHQGVCWLDAPGLDADVASGDDGHAMQAVWLQSDLCLFVHAAKEGELDAAERRLLAQLHADARQSGRQSLFVLSQVDQMADEQQLAQVTAAIARQDPQSQRFAVSCTRHRIGVEQGKPLMLERSGIPALQLALHAALALVPAARVREAERLAAGLGAELQQLRSARQDSLAQLRAQQAAGRERFGSDLRHCLDRVALDIRALLDVPGPDHSLTPDSFADQFKLTPAKRERNRLQVGYSKACIALGAVLVRHGVSELPVQQQTRVTSLDNVLVAVMGVYVKYRKDLQQIFCESAGRERMQREFSRYFEQSTERVALAGRIAATEEGIGQAERALAALADMPRPS